MSKETVTLNRPDVLMPEVATHLLAKKGVDLYMRDSPDDLGADYFKDYATKPFWDSPDLWVRNHDDNVPTHQNPLAGKTNWFYARITNRGTKPATLFFLNFKLTEFLGTEFIYPGDFLSHPETIAVNLEKSPLAPGQSRIEKMELKTPHHGHTCWLAALHTEGDWPQGGIHVWNSNNLAQKNLQLVTATPGQLIRIPFRAGSLYREQTAMYRMEVLRARKWTQMAASLVHPEAHKVEEIFKAADAPATFLKKEADLTVDTKGILHLAYHHGLRAGFPVTIPERTPVDLAIDLTIPKDAKPGEVIDTHLVQRDREGQVVGGFTVRVNVAANN